MRSREQKDGLILVPGFIGNVPNVEDKYTYAQYLSSGSSGSTWRIVRNCDQANFALKVTRLDVSHEGSMRTDIEVKCLEAVNHFACIRLYDKLRTNKFLFLVLEHCDAGDLRFQLNHQRQSMEVDEGLTGGTLPLGVGMEEYRVKFILLQLVLGLQYMHLHRKILHRDLKPANVLLTTNGLVKIGDFGLSNAYDTISGDVGRTICGTPAYLAPELWSGRHYGRPADMWSLGVLLFECLTTRTPFVGSSMEALKRSTLAEQVPVIPPGHYSSELVAIVYQLLEKDPEARPDSAALLSTPYLQRALADFPGVLAASNISGPLLKQVKQDIQRQLDKLPVYVIDTTIRFEGEVEKLKPPDQLVLRYLTLADGKLTIEKCRNRGSTANSRHRRPPMQSGNNEASSPPPDRSSSAHVDSRASTPLSDHRAGAAGNAGGSPVAPGRSSIPLSSIESAECLNAENFALRIGDRNFLFFRTPYALMWTEHLRSSLGWPPQQDGSVTNTGVIPPAPVITQVADGYSLVQGGEAQ